MEAGELVAGRFRIEKRVGSGAMGTVYRAMDQIARVPVALKILHEGLPEGAERFAREVSSLARLTHPRIVRYVAHGDSPHFVAMEWLDGMDLAARLREGPLSVRDAIDLAIDLAEALDHAHTLGIVHRDIKPSNLFFEHGESSRVRIVDFGLAWVRGDEDFRSVAGMILGTPGYMAPEQARGESVDARTDVFAIACVLYKCLTGRGPFSGDDAVGSLAKLLFHEPDAASSLQRAVPRAVDAVLARAMSKERDARQPSARAFADELRAAASMPASESLVPQSIPSGGITNRERRIVSVVVAARERLGADVSTLHCAADAVFVEKQAAIRAVAEGHGARLEILPVAIVAVISGRGGATDRAAVGARLALALSRVIGNVPVALATGRAEVAERSVGDVIDRAVARVTSKRDEEASVSIDETTAGLLGPTFVVRGSTSGMELTGEREADMRVRTLLGKPTPCVGRDRELAFLDATLAECESEDVARAVIVTAAPGIGKSRLRYEWLRKIGERDVETWTARADAMTMAAPFALLGQLVRRAAAIDSSEPVDATRARLRARVARHVANEADVLRIAEFLGEPIGARFPDEDRVQLRAARADAQLMGDQIRRAWEDWIAAECGAGPLVMVLEDLHWGDLPTVQLVEHALVHMSKSETSGPFMVLALARPEVRDVFPDLWRARSPLHLTLGELTAKASARLARHVLGDGAHESTIERVVARSAGNAFFLEEILRAIAEGRGDDIPETVLAIVQRRLDALEPDARRVLRAASVYGETFWRSAVSAQIESGARVDHWLAELARRELVTPRAESRFAGEHELTFRHALVREAAYATLTDDDRAFAHRVAGTWLEERDERDAAVLAEHFDRAGDRERAASHYVRAASQALEGGDLDQVLAHAKRGVALGASGEVLGELKRMAAEANRWRGEIGDGESCALEASELLTPGTPSWHAAIGELATCAGAQGHVDRILVARATLVDHGDATRPDWAVALARVVLQLYASGQREYADDGLARLAAHATSASPIVRGRVEQARATQALYSSDHGTYYEHMKSVRALFDLAGDRRNSCVQAANMGYVALVLGALDEAEELLVSMARVAESLGIRRIRAIFEQNIALLRHLQKRDAEAIPLARSSAETFERQRDLRLTTFSRIYLASALASVGRVDDAFAELERAVDVSRPLVPSHASALAHLADLELAHARGSPLEHASIAYTTLEKLGGLEDTESLIRVVYADALASVGRTSEARDVVMRAAESIRERASKIAVTRWRESFLQTNEHVRTFALAEKLA
jgi:tetratricopeptide (TPR) repeat protein